MVSATTRTTGSMTSPVTILIDADPIVYRVGFSLEKRTYYLQYRDVALGFENDPRQDVEYLPFFHNAAARDEFIRLHNLHRDEHASVMVPVPEKNEAIVFGRVKATIKDIENNVGAYLYESGQEVGETRLFLSGSTNFRNDIATITPYKGSRLNSPKPYWYKEIRDYMIKWQGAEVTVGIEADDQVVIEQYASPEADTIICTIDKDLRMAEGHFYDYGKKRAEYISESMARTNFYRQLCMGDSTDDIPGCYRVGKAGAAALIEPNMTEKQQYAATMNLYEGNVVKYPDHHGGLTAKESLIENARLLWMMRTPDDFWTPPGQPNGSLKGYLEKYSPGDPDGDWL
jgi:hypothetical protein